APSETLVPAPAMFTVVAPVLKRFAVPAVVVTDPPLTAALPAVVTLPVSVDAPSTVSVPLAWTLPAFETLTPVAPYPPPTVRESTEAAALLAVNVVALAKFTVALLIVAVPVAAPSVSVVAAPPMERLVAPVLKSVAV